ncbi:MAG: hypothetical protein GHCLOJNM_00160 [bacterium]|nr:hypothetical protein [bacterium]
MVEGRPRRSSQLRRSGDCGITERAQALLDSLLLALLATVFSGHIRPFISWGDGPELLTAAWRDGVAHPTGYPLYLLALKTFGCLPLGSVAFKGNLFSAACALLAFGLLFRMIPIEKENHWKGIGWRLGLLAFALSPLVIRQAVTTEVYAFSLLLAASCLFLGARFVSQPSERGLLMVALLAGLALGHHRLLVFLLPGLALWLAGSLRTWNPPRRLFPAAAALFGLAVFGPYLVLWLRARSDIPLNWEDPSTFGNLWKVFSAHQFRTDQEILRVKEWMAHEQGFSPSPIRLTLESLTGVPGILWSALGLSLGMAFLGVGHSATVARRAFGSGLAAWALPTVFIAQYHVADQADFHLLPLLVWALAAGVGWGAALEWARSKTPMLPWTLVALALLSVSWRLRAIEGPSPYLLELPERLARRTLDQPPPGAVLIAVPARAQEPVDYTYFPLLYHKEVARRGARVALLSEGFFTSPWYEKTLLREGIHSDFFQMLAKGTDRVPLEEKILTEFLEAATPRPTAPLTRIYKVGGRIFLENRHTLALLMVERLFPSFEERPLYLTGLFQELERYLPRPVEWRECLRVPILTEGHSDLDRMPVPSGKLYRLELQNEAMENGP